MNLGLNVVEQQKFERAITQIQTATPHYKSCDTEHALRRSSCWHYSVADTR